jgi:hypothetical protein
MIEPTPDQVSRLNMMDVDVVVEDDGTYSLVGRAVLTADSLNGMPWEYPDGPVVEPGRLGVSGLGNPNDVEAWVRVYERMTGQFAWPDEGQPAVGTFTVT